MQSWELFTVYVMAPSSLGHPLLSPAWRPGNSVADIFGDSGQHREASGPSSMPFCKAPPNPGVCGFRGRV